MNIHDTIRTLVMAAITAGCLAVPAMADDTPQPVQTGNAAYITGGVGDDEQQALAAVAKDYNLKITNADAEGHYATDTTIKITGKDGHDLLNVNGAGPLFFVRLQPGEYTIQATNSGQSETRKVKVSGQKQTNLYLRWN